MAINRGTAALVIACLLIAVTLADALPLPLPLVCDKVHGVQKHETCFAVSQAEGLSLKKFLRFNPNINCNNLFIGQWVWSLTARNRGSDLPSQRCCNELLCAPYDLVRVAALLIVSLLVAVTLADATPTLTVHRDTLGGARPQPPELVCTKIYGVQQRHETCFALAQAGELTLEQFFSFNPNINCQKLFIGHFAMAINRGTAALVIMCLLVVVVTLADALPLASPLVCDKVYGVQKHETCFAVAQAEGLSLKKFLRFNPNINCNNLFIGQWVCLHAHRA
nr:unnamed protein product [Digitaria exilis]